MKRVLQRHTKDCAVAALAMFTDGSYEEAASLLPKDIRNVGVYLIQIAEAASGHLGATLAEWVLREGKPLPARDAILEVATVNRVGGHFVFAAAAGTVLDPSPTVESPQRIEGYIIVRAIYRANWG